VQGPDSWAGRPKDVETIRVSTLKPELRAIFKTLIGKRRWTTHPELERLAALKNFRFMPDPPRGDPNDLRPE